MGGLNGHHKMESSGEKEFMLNKILWGILLWYAIGCFILGFIDDEGKLHKWAKESPFGEIGFVAVVLFWPVVVYKFRSS